MKIGKDILQYNFYNSYNNYEITKYKYQENFNYYFNFFFLGLRNNLWDLLNDKIWS